MRETRINRKAQALVEFIIILPILLLILMGIIDMGRIVYNKIMLESEASKVVNLINNGKSTQEVNEIMNLDIDIQTKDNNSYKEVIITKKIDIIMPGLNLILDNPYQIKVTRSILNDS